MQELSGHAVSSVQQMGWSRKTNGALLALIGGRFDVFLTVDQNLAYQQNLKNLPFAIVVLRAKSNKIEDLRPLVPRLLTELKRAKPGMIIKLPA